MSGSAQDNVDGVAPLSFEVAAPQLAVVFHVPDDGFDAVTAFETFLLLGGNAAFLTHHEDFGEAVVTMTSVTLIHLGFFRGGCRTGW